MSQLGGGAHARVRSRTPCGLRAGLSPRGCVLSQAGTRFRPQTPGPREGKSYKTRTSKLSSCGVHFLAIFLDGTWE